MGERTGYEIFNDGTLRCGFCGQDPEAHSDSDAGPMSVCPEHSDGPGSEA